MSIMAYAFLITALLRRLSAPSTKARKIHLMDYLPLLTSIYDFMGLCYEPMFMRRAALALLLLSLSTSMAGVMVVNLKMAFFSDAVSHSIFAGMALAIIWGLPEKPAVLAFTVGLGLLVVYLGRHSRLAADTVIGLVFSGVIAFGLAVVSRTPVAAKTINRFLLGDILTVDDKDIAALAALAVLTCLFMIFFFNQLTISSISPAIAHSRAPLKTRLAAYAFGAYLALVVMVAVWSVGVLLVTAFLVAPAATGRNSASSLAAMFWIAVGASVFSGQAGLYLSARPAVNTATGATAVMVAISLFVVSLTVKKIKKNMLRG